nr:MAG TPA: hypothetical protein [Caudoviricetes sp.]
MCLSYYHLSFVVVTSVVTFEVTYIIHLKSNLSSYFLLDL